MKRFFWLAALLYLTQAAHAQTNLLRNGSFEGATKYWFGDMTLDTENAKHGHTCARFPGIIHSAPFSITVNKTVTLSFWAKADHAGTMYATLCPADRDNGREPYRRFWGKSGVPSKVTAEWQRFSYDLPIPGDMSMLNWGDKSKSSWMLFLHNVPQENAPKTLWVDGVTLAYNAGKDKYVSFSPVEVAVCATNLPGYTTNANILNANASVNLKAALFNPGAAAISTVVTWELLDYTGTRRLAPSDTASVKLAAGAAVTLSHTMKLAGKGLQIARVRVMDAKGKTLGQSDQPLTSLAYPKAAAKFDPAERFGGTITAGQPAHTQLTDAAQKIGLAWSRWYPHTNWTDIQPDGPDKWNWPDAILDDLWQRGIGVNFVLYDLPKWAKGKSDWIPRDMETWTANDKRWNDLSLKTAWDTFVTTTVKRFAGRGYVYEFMNEPEFGHYDAALYTAFFRRTQKLVKAADSGAKIMHNSINGGPDGITRGFLANGGAPICDIFSFHNYTSGGYMDEAGIRAMRNAFRAGGKVGGDVEIWMNEGWAHFPSSEDYAAAPRIGDRSAVWVADMVVRNVSETFAAGMDKCIAFIMGYDDHGMSWWDWAGDGTEWFDADNQPTVAVGAFNVLADRLGRSHRVSSIHTPQFVFHIFHDERHDKGVAVVWGLEKAQVLTLPAGKWAAMDVMGNPIPLTMRKTAAFLPLSVPERPVYLVPQDSVSGEKLASAFASFAPPVLSLKSSNFTLTPDWYHDGNAPNPFKLQGEPLWTLGRVWPMDAARSENYGAFPQWEAGTSKWIEPANIFGGNPAGSILPDGSVNLTAVGPRTGGDVRASYLAFTAPADGNYTVTGKVHTFRWEGGGDLNFDVLTLNRDMKTIKSISHVVLKDREPQNVNVVGVKLNAGEELVFRFTVDAFNTQSGLTFDKLVVTRQ